MFSNFKITWSSVKDAAKYDIYINDDIYTSSLSYLDVNFLDDGEYSVYVVSVAGDMRSEPSDKISFIIERTLDSTLNIRTAEKTLYWDIVEEAISYIVVIDEIEYLVDNNYYSLENLEDNIIHTIEVKAKFQNDLTSEKSTITYSNFTLSNISFNENFTRDKIKKLEKTLDKDTIVYYLIINEEVNNSYSFLNNNLIIPKSTIYQLDNGSNIIDIYTNNGIIKTTLQIIDTGKPHLVSENSYIYNENMELTLLFELYNKAVITQLTATSMTDDDYIIDGNTATISSDFLRKVFIEDSITSLLISYTLDYDETFSIGYLIINI